MFGTCLKNVAEKAPTIHSITNYVTVNDVANVILACGAKPVMADDPAEAEDITGISGGLYLNLGTLSERRLESMLRAGREANRLERPVVLDPVGAGASSFRTEAALRLTREIKISAIRGNSSEINTLARGHGSTAGVEASLLDAVTKENLAARVRFIKRLSKTTGAVIAMTGGIDLVGDGNTCFCITNGRTEMSRITGTGCQLSGLMAAFITANQGSALIAAAASVCMYGLAGEIAWGRMKEGEGTASYRMRIIDAVSTMDAVTLERGAKYDVY